MGGNKIQVTLLLVCMCLTLMPSSASLKQSDEEIKLAPEEIQHSDKETEHVHEEIQDSVKEIKPAHEEVQNSDEETEGAHCHGEKHQSDKEAENCSPNVEQEKKEIDIPPVKIEVDTPFAGPSGPFITYDECGGVINARSDVAHSIQYKFNQNYTNNELCIWTIRNTDGAGLVFYKYPSEFDVVDNSDFIQISNFNKDLYFEPWESVTLGKTSASEQVTLGGPVAFVIFSTDFRGNGKGFKLMVNTICGPAYDYTYSDLSSSLPAGSLSLQPYSHNMMSTFVVAPNTPTAVIIHYGTESCCDHVAVFKIEQGYSYTGGKINFGYNGRKSGCNGDLFWLTDSKSKDHSALIFILTSDGSGLGAGPEITWK